MSNVNSQNTFPGSGNVGIGTTSPTSPLTVFSLQSGATNPILEVNALASTFPNNQLREIFSIKNFQPNWTYKTEFVVRNDGNVGIGTSTPTTTLDVVGNARFSTAATTGLATLQSLIVTSNTTLNGFVGVGVANPLEKLDIAGNIKLNNNIIYLRGNYDYNHGLRWCSSSVPFGGITTSDGPVLFGWNGGVLGSTAGGQKVALRWNSNQQVVIGNQIPNGVYATTYGLAVDGDIVAKRVVVQTASWADKVFDKSYILQPLSEIEAFVKENCHLPQIPTEKEVIENGIDVSEMNKLLLQKVEELTLYLIKQDKSIKELEQIVNAKN